ncbi:hypothetical protein E1A91_D04G159800v1 [Gossypium mustelinum]|uniref:Uncharacterized protein n=1 Tax=Gossypium mustelinum TaxID=34275 RepID=A0A5D2VEG5_GOSMU|nr:hypothetical protein E1A91_D04G159800v1 [Gossypium mustelinum]
MQMPYLSLSIIILHYLSPLIIILHYFPYCFRDSLHQVGDYPLPQSPSGSQYPGPFELLGGMQSLLPQKKKMSLKSGVKIDLYKRPFRKPSSRLLDTSS